MCSCLGFKPFWMRSLFSKPLFYTLFLVFINRRDVHHSHFTRFRMIEKWMEFPHRPHKCLWSIFFVFLFFCRSFLSLVHSLSVCDFSSLIKYTVLQMSHFCLFGFFYFLVPIYSNQQNTHKHNLNENYSWNEFTTKKKSPSHIPLISSTIFMFVFKYLLLIECSLNKK